MRVRWWKPHFLVAYIVPEDAWYVVPIEVFETRTAVKFFPTSKRRMSRFEKYREAWCLMACPKDGGCRTEISVERLCEAGAACPKSTSSDKSVRPTQIKSPP